MTDSSPYPDVRAHVRQRYGQIAETFQPGQAASCCGSSQSACCASDDGARESDLITLYEDGLAEGLPEEVTGLSLGCGDPVTLAALEPGQTVLDLGSGGGIDCFLAARQVGPSGRVIGVDMTPAMIERARANRERLGAGNVEFRLGEIEYLPVPDESVDVIISNCVINLSPDKPQVLGDAWRVLKPGGRLSVSDVVIEGEFSPELLADMESWAECVAGAIDLEDYRRMLQDAGFSDVQVVDKTPAEDLVPRQPGMPRLFSARLTARKPASLVSEGTSHVV